jgi:hypothetical protein
MITPLVRYADIDANNAHGGDFNNLFDFGDDSAWGYNNGFNIAYGVMLSTVPTSTFHFGFVQNVASGPDPCSPVANLPSTPFFGDGSVGFDWNGTLGAGRSVTAKGEYRRF